MQLPIVLVAFITAIKQSDGTICYLARAQATDTQIASWEAMLMPIRYTVDQMDRAMVIASQQDPSMPSLRVKASDTMAFKDMMASVNQKTVTYWATRNDPDPFQNISSDFTQFQTNLKDFLQLLRELPPETVKMMSDVPREGNMNLLAEMEAIIGSLVKRHDASSIPSELSELANLKLNFKAGKEDIKDQNNILPTSLKHLKRGVAMLTKGKTTLFLYDMSLRVEDVRRRFNKFLEYADKAIDTQVSQQPGVQQLLECMRFRMAQEIQYLKEIWGWYAAFCKNHEVFDGEAIKTNQGDYQTALDAIEKKTNEARDKVKEYANNAVDGYNKWLDETAAKMKL